MATAYQFGQFVYNQRGLARVFKVASTTSSIYSGASIAAGGIEAATAATVGLSIPAAIAVAGTLYGAKQIYDGVKGLF